MKNELYFIPHCENDDCDLGRAFFKCPQCQKLNSNYDLWWKQEDLYKSDGIIIYCDFCYTPLLASYSNDIYNDFIFSIEILKTKL